jgi:hypothetical protein
MHHDLIDKLYFTSVQKLWKCIDGRVLTFAIWAAASRNEDMSEEIPNEIKHMKGGTDKNKINIEN